jgi:hypothetical protein
MENIINIIIEITTKISSCSLNSIWIGLGITEISFLRLLQLMFFVIFIVLNICLIYIEYLDKKSKIKDNSEYLQSGSSNKFVPHLKRYSTYFLAGGAAFSSLISIKNEVLTFINNNQAIEVYKKNSEKAKEESKNINDQRLADNMHSKLNMDCADRSLKKAIKINDDRSELQKSISEDLENYTKTGDKS